MYATAELLCSHTAPGQRCRQEGKHTGHMSKLSAETLREGIAGD